MKGWASGAALVLVLGGGPEAGAAPRTYAVDAEPSRLVVHVAKTGVFGFAGHNHLVQARAVAGEIVADPDDLARSSVTLTFGAKSLEVSGEGEPAGDAPKVQEIMLGPKVLDVGRFPEIAFKSTKVAGRAVGATYDVRVDGELTLHGLRRPLSLPLRVEMAGESLTATGRIDFKQTGFGIQPVSAVGGTVKVKDEVEVEFKIVARAR